MQLQIKFVQLIQTKTQSITNFDCRKHSCAYLRCQLLKGKIKHTYIACLFCRGCY